MLQTLSPSLERRFSLVFRDSFFALKSVSFGKVILSLHFSLFQDLDDIEDENEQLKQENKTLLKVVGQLTR